MINTPPLARKIKLSLSKLCIAAASAVLLAGYAAGALLSEKCSYGEDGDSFLSALSALNLARHATYSPSRLPGFPLFERLLSLTAEPDDARKSKLLLAIVSFVNIALLFAMFGRMKIPRGISLLLCLAAAVFPLYVQNTFVVMDYHLVLFFVLSAALVFPAPDSRYASGLLRAFGAGLLLSLAVATRITAVLFVVALVASLLQGKNQGGRRWAHFISFCIGAAILAPLFYFGVYEIYGLHFLSGYPRDFSLVQLIAENARIGVRFFGGLIGIAVGAVVLQPLVRPSRGFHLQKAWSTVPMGMRAFIAFALLNSTFHLLYPYEAAYHTPLWFAVVLILAACQTNPSLWRVLLLVFGTAAGCVVMIVPSRATLLKTVPGAVAQEFAGQRSHKIMYDRISTLAGVDSSHALFLSYSAVEKVPVWFFDHCMVYDGVSHPACRTFWKSPTEYRYPVYSLNTVVLASPVHVQSASGMQTLRDLTARFGVSRVLVEGGETAGEDSARIAAAFGPACAVENFTKEIYR